MLQLTELIIKRSLENNQQEKEIKIKINFYVNKLNQINKKAHGYCLVIQPIIIAK